jgi:hemerythrin
MDMIQWDEGLSVGVPEIDEQHKILIGFINKLTNLEATGKEADVAIQSVLSGLFNYTSYHFFAEEQIMEASGYPDYDRHKGEHAALTADVIDYFDRFVGGERDIHSRLYEFLKGWLLNHILMTDKGLGNYLNSKDRA